MGLGKFLISGGRVPTIENWGGGGRMYLPKEWYKFCVCISKAVFIL